MAGRCAIRAGEHIRLLRELCGRTVQIAGRDATLAPSVRPGEAGYSAAMATLRPERTSRPGRADVSASVSITGWPFTMTAR